MTFWPICAVEIRMCGCGRVTVERVRAGVRQVLTDDSVHRNIVFHSKHERTALDHRHKDWTQWTVIVMSIKL